MMENLTSVLPGVVSDEPGIALTAMVTTTVTTTTSEKVSVDNVGSVDNLIRIFRKLHPAAALEFIQQIETERPELFGVRVWDSALRPSAPSSPAVPSVKPNFKDNRGTDARMAMEDEPIVQFSSFMYFCVETEKQMTLDLMRIGDLSKSSTVHFATKDGTAKSGVKYKDTSGTVTFEPGESEKEISIDLFDDPVWDSTTEFFVELTKDGVNGPQGCSLGKYLWIARVKVIDANKFPSDKYKEQLASGEMEQVSKWALFLEYVKLTWSDAIIKKGTIKMIMLDFCHNLYFLVKLFINVILVDQILYNGSPDTTSTSASQLLLLAAVVLVPFAILHFCDIQECTWKVAGTGRAILQKSLMRKFLNRDESARAQLNQSDLLMAITRDSTKLVHDGYIHMIQLLRSATQLFAILFYQIMAPIVFGKPPSSLLYAILCGFPLPLICFLYTRRKITTKYIKDMNEKQDELVGQLNRNVQNYRMIADYNRRPFFVDRFEAKIKEFNGTAAATSMVLKNNNYFAAWLTVFCVSLYTVIGGLNHLSDKKENTLGMFLANLSVINSIGTSWGNIYSVLMTLQGTFPALDNITWLQNLPIDVPKRMALNRDRRTATISLRSQMLQTLSEGLPLDYLPIYVDNVQFSYSDKSDGEQAFNSKGRLEVQQGQLVALVGPRGQGKSTLLKLIGGVILPTPGGLFTPSHLRVLHVSTDPLFFLGNLFENLSFGVTPGDPDGTVHRCVKICEKIGIVGKVIELVAQGDEGEKLAWNELLSWTQRCQLCLVRALVANPEVLCIHKPTMAYDENTSERVLRVLGDFCRDKGIEQNPAKRHMRRPRTCIFTSSKYLGVSMSDSVFLVSKQTGIMQVDKNDVTAEMLD